MGEPSQKARDAAADLMDALGKLYPRSVTTAIRFGEDTTHPYAQAFAVFEADIRAEYTTPDAESVGRLVAAIDAWIEDGCPATEQLILDAREELGRA